MAALAAAVPEHAAEGARERHTFGTTLIGNQQVRFTLAALRTETEEIRAAALHTVRPLTSGGWSADYAAACKYRAAQVLNRVADLALQPAGADAYATGPRVNWPPATRPPGHPATPVPRPSGRCTTVRASPPRGAPTN